MMVVLTYLAYIEHVGFFLGFFSRHNLPGTQKPTLILIYAGHPKHESVCDPGRVHNCQDFFYFFLLRNQLCDCTLGDRTPLSYGWLPLIKVR